MDSGVRQNDEATASPIAKKQIPLSPRPPARSPNKRGLLLRAACGCCRRMRCAFRRSRRFRMMRGRGLMIRPPVLRLRFRLARMARPRRRRFLLAALLVMTAARFAALLALSAIVALPAAPLPLQDRLRLRVAVRLEAGNHFLRNVALDQLFDIAQKRVLVDADERDRFAG